MRLLLRCAAALLALPLAAHALPVTYTQTATASGTYNGQSFNDVLVTFTGSSDTANVDYYIPPNTFYSPAPITVTITGFGSTTLAGSDLFFADNSSGLLGIVDASSGSFVIDQQNYGSTYDLTTALSPLTGAALTYGSASTANGTLFISSASNVTFQAVVTTTPEPSSFALLGTGVLGLLGAARKRLA